MGMRQAAQVRVLSPIEKLPARQQYYECPPPTLFSSLPDQGLCAQSFASVVAGLGPDRHLARLVGLRIDSLNASWDDPNLLAHVIKVSMPHRVPNATLPFCSSDGIFENQLLRTPRLRRTYTGIFIGLTILSWRSNQSSRVALNFSFDALKAPM